MSITEFLLARIAEDEAVARAAIDPSGISSSTDGEWEFAEYPYEGEWPLNPDAENVLWSESDWAFHASRHDPARILAECAAKRAIVADCRALENSGHPGIALRFLASLAAVHAEHEDYRDEWPGGGVRTNTD